MSRVKINIPENNIAKIEIPVRISDINYGNHLGNDTLISILHEARVQWLAKGGFTELAIGGASLIMSDLAVEYKSEGFYGDLLSLHLSIGEVSNIHFDLFFLVENQNGKIVAKAKNGMVGYNYEQKKIAALPDTFKAFLLQKV